MPVAVVTMAYNETALLPIWARYYGRQVGYANLFVVDHGSDPAALESLPRGVSLLRIPRSEVDELKRAKFINNVKSGLLRYFDCVIYTDTDEFIVADPGKHESLASYCRDCAPIVAPAGLELFHAIDREKPLNLKRPIMEQRSYCQFYSMMSKPVIVKVDAKWSPGFHYCSEMPSFAADIFLFHLKSMDQDLSLQRLELTRSITWAKSNLERGIAKHQRRGKAEHLANYFERPTAALKAVGAAEFKFEEEINRLRGETTLGGRFYRHDQFRGPVVRIPERFKGLF